MDLRRRSRSRSEARDRLVLGNLRLVSPIARSVKRNLPPQFLLDDLIQAGTLGLITAASRWKSSGSRNPAVHFRAFASHRIRGAILDSVSGSAYRNSTTHPLTGRFYSSDPQLAQAERRADLDRISIGLTELEADLIHICYLEGATVPEAARRIGLKTWRGYALHARALKKLHLAAREDFCAPGDYTGVMPRVSAIKESKTPNPKARALLVDELGALQEDITRKEAREKTLIAELRSWAEHDTKPARPIVYEGRMYVANVGPRGSRQQVADKAAVLVILGKEQFLEACTFSVEKAERLLRAEDLARVVVVDQFCSPRTVKTAPRAEVTAKKSAA